MISAFLAVILGCLSIVSPAIGGECPHIFQRYCAHHSYCLPTNSKCDILASYENGDQMDQILSLHNKRRSEVASGMTKLPSASNMLQMEWDDELAAVAQQYANQCIYAHDKANCRRVSNFGVGQNLAIQKRSGGDTAQNLPQPDWDFAVNAWYDEIQYTTPALLCPFGPPADGSEEYRHFTQLAWATSFRVGCGYVLYKEGSDTYTRLYVCNYGPAGNVYGSCVYKAGKPCSDCPIGQKCDEYQGLCRRTDNLAPMYPPPEPHLFYCAFQSNPDCGNYINDNHQWVIEPTLGGNYLGIVLQPGNNSTIVFKKKIKPNTKTFCLIVKYRKGPNKFTDNESNKALLMAYIPSQKYTVSQPLPSYPNPERQQFSTYSLTLSWDLTTEVKISFAVPNDATSQFLNVKSIAAFDGDCSN